MPCELARKRPSATEIIQYTEVMQHYLFVIDDIGREEPYQEYGNRFNVLPDLVDDCERRGKLLITTTKSRASECRASSLANGRAQPRLSNCTTAELAELSFS